jgi:phosphoserine phosphatase
MPLRLAFFDLDGTLKRERDPYVYLHRCVGTWEACQPYLAQGLAGELDYDEWLRLDVGLWRGMSQEVMEDHLHRNPYLPGAREAVTALKQAGVQLALVSTGLDLHARLVQHELGIDHSFANQVLIRDGLVTGEARTVVREGAKGDIVAQLQAELGVAPEDCLAVGDGTSDADMFPRVRFGVAVNAPSERLRAAAHLVIEEADLSGLLPRLEELAPGWLPLAPQAAP